MSLLNSNKGLTLRLIGELYDDRDLPILVFPILIQKTKDMDSQEILS